MKKMLEGALGLLLVIGCSSPTTVTETVECKWQFVDRREYRYEFTEEIHRRSGRATGKVATGDIAKVITKRGTVKVLCGKVMAKVSLSYEKSGAEAAPFLRTEQCIAPTGAVIVPEKGPAVRNDLLFPIPGRPLLPGEVLKQEMVVAESGAPPLCGTGEFSYVGREAVDGMPCIQYQVSADLRFDPKPKDRDPKTVEMRADMNVLFAVDRGCCVSVEGVTRKRVSRALKGLSEAEQGKATLEQETRRIKLRLVQ